MPCSFRRWRKCRTMTRRLATAYLRAVGLIALIVSAVCCRHPSRARTDPCGPGSPLVCGRGTLSGPRNRHAVSNQLQDQRFHRSIHRRRVSPRLAAGALCHLCQCSARASAALGIVGVAWAALAALTFNFIVMASLSLDVAQTTWREFWGVHRPAVMLTVVTFPLVWLVTMGSRTLDLPAPIILLTGGSTLLAVCAALVWCAPTVFLGEEGQWMVETMRSFLTKLVARPAARARREGTAEPVPLAPDAGESR